eukprot:COSAG02_NODE_384_length_23406_cov_9.459733_11_plen_148_part_00
MNHGLVLIQALCVSMSLLCVCSVCPSLNRMTTRRSHLDPGSICLQSRRNHPVNHHERTSFQAPESIDLNRAPAGDPKSNAHTRPLLAWLRLNRFGCMCLLSMSLGLCREIQRSVVRKPFFGGLEKRSNYRSPLPTVPIGALARLAPG